jgi:undecaprenyl-diphosphatase
MLDRHRSTAGTLVLGATALFGVVALWMMPATAWSESQADGQGLSVFAAIVLGLVEGVTEYLPISSTGHLLVTNEILGLGGTDSADKALEAYAICIQAGAILAVFVVYLERVRQMLEGLLGRSEEGRRILAAVVVAFVPTALIAVAIFDLVREQLFGVTPIAIAWFVGGLVIIALSRSGFFDRAGVELTEITLRQAGLIGVMQALAVWPGTSRSLVTIIAGVLVGLTLRAAVEFAFLLGLVTLSAATVFAGLSDGQEMIDNFGYVTPIVGLVVAFVSAVAAVRWMVAWLNERGFEVFGWYRLAIGVLAFAAMGVGWL